MCYNSLRRGNTTLMFYYKPFQSYFHPLLWGQKDCFLETGGKVKQLKVLTTHAPDSAFVPSTQVLVRNHL